MDCDTCRALLLVYGDDKRATPDVAAHLSACTGCRVFDEANTDLVVALAAPRPVMRAPSLASRVAERRQRPRRLLIRLALMAIGIGQLAFVMAAWRHDVGNAAHEGHELNSLDAALAVGFLTAAYRPWRSAGLVPLVGVAAGLLWLTAADDIADGRTAWHHEATHLLTMVGFVLLTLAVRAPLTPSTPLTRRLRARLLPAPRRHLHALRSLLSGPVAPSAGYANTIRGLPVSRSLRRVAVVAVLSTVAALGLSGTALAHVTVNSTSAVAGGYAKLTFRMPNERSDATATKLEVAFPADHPFASVGVKPQPGWTYAVTKKHLDTPITSDDGSITDAVSRIVWTAVSGGGVKPGEFDEFDVSVGPLPEVPSLEFKALQTYSDGAIVRWIQSSTPGKEGPEHPAPVLTVAPVKDADAASPSATPAGTDPTASPAAAAPSADAGAADSTGSSGTDSSSTATVLSVIALVVALGAAALAALGARRRRPATT